MNLKQKTISLKYIINSMLTGFNNQCEQIGKVFIGKGSSKKV